MKKIIFLLFIWISIIYANVAVVGDNYNKIVDDNIEVLYSDEHKELSKKVLSYEKGIIKSYEKSFGYKLDDMQRVGILSSHNQIANGYSTQIPFNLQIDYSGGALMSDYFCTSSWIRELLIHESAHNFQLNPKKNKLSFYAHKIVKNAPLTWLGFVPIFPIPNFAESSFILEGNAVLNESRFNLGGRLYSGEYLAMVITQARAKYITPQRTYNEHLYFPYRSHHYIVGGFFQAFLAQKYGIDRVNSYFYNFSGQWIPLFTNSIFQKTFGQNYEELLCLFSKDILDKHKNFRATKGKKIASSKSKFRLFSNKKEISFLSSNHLSNPLFYTYQKDSKKIKFRESDFISGRFVQKDDKYYTSASKYSAVDKIEIALFDENANILNESRSKAVQAILSDGRFVYFDIASSFDSPSLFVGDEFYGHVNSSVYVDSKDNIYYAIQKGKTRTIYKNRKPLFSYQGWYGFVSDVDGDNIIFIASTSDGSSVYSFCNGEIKRLSHNDDIVDAKVIDKNSLLVETIGADSYNFYEINKEPFVSDIFEIKYFFEDDKRFKDFDFSAKSLKKDATKYNALTNLTYSSLEQGFEQTEDDFVFNLSANFEDPLSQNQLNIYFSKYDSTVAGIGYKNSAYRLSFGIDIFGVIEAEDGIDSRDYGANISLDYPFYLSPFSKIDTSLDYIISEDKEEQSPLILSMNFLSSRSFGHSMYPNDYQKLSIFGSKYEDNSDFSVGMKYKITKDLGSEFYLGGGVEYAKADIENYGEKDGIKIVQRTYAPHDNISLFEMPSLKDDLFVKEIGVGELSLHKVLNLHKYSFYFPLSLRREAIYAKYRYYDITTPSNEQNRYNELTLGSTFDLLLIHNFPIPLSMEYIYNDDLEDSNKFRLIFDISFE